MPTVPDAKPPKPSASSHSSWRCSRSYGRALVVIDMPSLFLLISLRQHDPHLEPTAVARMKLQRAAVQARDPLDDGEADPRAARPAMCVPAALKRSLQRFELGGRKTGAAIAD